MSHVRFRVMAVDDAGSFQRLTGRGEGGEILDDLYRPQPDGLSTVPKIGALGWASFAGSRERGLVVSVESGSDRPRGKPEGSRILYGPAGSAINQPPGGDIVHTAPGGAFKVDAQTVTIEAAGASVTVSGSGDIVVAPPPGGKVYLGGKPTEGSYALVQTVGGTSINVFARIG